MIIDGKKIAADIRSKVKEEISKLVAEYSLVPTLAVVLVGEDPASMSYVKGKEKVCAEVGIHSETIRLSADVSEKELIDTVKELSYNANISGILVQLPLPKHIDCNHVIDMISPDKDVDGFTPTNLGKMLIGQDCFIPCTPNGIMKLIDSAKIDLNGKNVVVIGRSNIVGKPIVNLLTRKVNNATVTWCHTGTRKNKLWSSIADADVVITAAGCPNLFNYNYLSPDTVLIDVGVNRIKIPFTEGDHYRLVGDVFDEENNEMMEYFHKYNISATPVPGGVGPMTIAMLCYNTLQAFKKTIKLYE